MKKPTIIGAIGLTLLFACNQSPTEINPQNDVITDTTEVFTYSHIDGRLIEITNIYSGDKSSVLVTVAGKTNNLPQIETSDSSATFKKGNLQLRTLFTKIFLKENNQPEQELILINPITVSYQNKEENVIAEYHTIDAKTPYVIIQRQDGNEYKLTQTSAFAKGASYSNDSVQWDSNANEATLKINKKEIHLKEISIDEIMKPLQK